MAVTPTSSSTGGEAIEPEVAPPAPKVSPVVAEKPIVVLNPKVAAVPTEVVQSMASPSPPSGARPLIATQVGQLTGQDTTPSPLRATFFPQIPPFTGPLALNAKGELPLQLNQRLAQLGLLTRAPDDTFDAATQQAVAAFQKKNGVTTMHPGVVNQETWSLLFAVNVDLSSIDVPAVFAAVRAADRNAFPNPVDANSLETVFSDIERLIGKPGITLGELVGHLCIMYNETGGTFRPVTERGPPAYMMTTNGGKKRSYNEPPNLLAGIQLRDWKVISAQPDIDAWNSTTVYPVDQPAAVQARALDCDFYKFRGRGLCQVTWRDGYAKHVDPFLGGKTSASMSDADLTAAFQQPSVYCGVFRSFVRDPTWAGEALPSLIIGDYSQYPLFVAGKKAFAYQKLFEARAALVEAEILKRNPRVQA
jgi:hypothetical protein